MLLIRRKTGNYGIDVTKSFYNRKTRKFLTGLLPRVQAYLAKEQIIYSVNDLRENSLQVNFSHELKGITFYDYQEDAISKFCDQKRGVLKLATSAGKTIIAKGIFKALNVPTLFLTHRLNLLHQSAKRFKDRLPEYKGKIGIVGGGETDWNFLTFGMAQTLYSMLKNGDNDEIRNVLGAFKMVIIDEAHRMKSDQFNQVVAACVNAEYRCGLTATPFMRNDPAEDMNLIGGTGEIICEVGAEQLVDAGILAKPYVKYIRIDAPANIKHLYEYREIYKAGIMENEYRNKAIVKAILEVMKVRKGILTVVNNIRHGEILLDLLNKEGIITEFCNGSNSAQEREKIIDKLSQGKIDVLLATNIMDEGISCNEIEAVVLAGGGKSAPANLQRVGRSMRIKEKGNYCIIVDFYDMTHKILQRHSKLRYDLFKKDKAYTILNEEKKK